MPLLMIGTLPVRTHYQSLGVDDGASREDLRVAYLGLMRLVHPDSQAAKINSLVVAASEINEAYAVLKNPQTRLAYDEKLALGRFPLRMLTRTPQREKFLADGTRMFGLMTLFLLVVFSSLDGIVPEARSEISKRIHKTNNPLAAVQGDWAFTQRR